MTGLYQFSSVASIQLPTADLEEQAHNIRDNQLEPNGDSSSPNNGVVVLTRKGHKFNPEDKQRTPNQDRVLVLSRRNDTGENNGDNDWWLGLFDGHGYRGHAVSQHVSSEFARRINNEWENESVLSSSKTVSGSENSRAMVKDTIQQIFLDINRSIPSFMDDAGCTAISVLKRGHLLFLSNLGDSSAFVVSYNKLNNSQSKPKIIYATKPHKPDSPDERTRIEANGGQVQDAPFEGASARLIIPVKIGSQYFEIGLAMSRSLGDHDGEKVGLSAEPDTDVLDLTQLDKNQGYIVVAVTDGLVDFSKLSEEEVALSMTQAMSTTQNTDNRTSMRSPKVPLSATEAATELIMRASKIWDSEPGNYRDDISIVAHELTI
eukprot:CAMPEP_0201214726 /NCGR_PEP_ID=MMETSP0851-20130426/188560_1 /ASSEMBLY_ACC=CAM_ASM_000631 /TAXON_ID=183588 /ORGANISM="Pseudo-nitzschia fraudulenta, Strain WWA7" /LENGTH=375 /DNA_ID=CAMNT_0047504095 /DNA_START=212 /DNA_END=1339 /DNA_ORIENTATION=-